MSPDRMSRNPSVWRNRCKRLVSSMVRISRKASLKISLRQEQNRYNIEGEVLTGCSQERGKRTRVVGGSTDGCGRESSPLTERLRTKQGGSKSQPFRRPAMGRNRRAGGVACVSSLARLASICRPVCGKHAVSNGPHTPSTNRLVCDREMERLACCPTWWGQNFTEGYRLPRCLLLPSFFLGPSKEGAGSVLEDEQQTVLVQRAARQEPTENRIIEVDAAREAAFCVLRFFCARAPQ